MGRRRFDSGRGGVDHEAAADHERRLVEWQAGVPDARARVSAQPGGNAQLGGQRGGGDAAVGVEPADADPGSLVPALRRDADELEGFIEFLAAEIAHPGLASLVGGVLADDAVRAGMRSLPAAGADGHHGYAGGLLEHTVGVATLARETAQHHPRLRADLLLAAALLHDVGRVRELGPGPSFRPTREGAILGHVQLGVRLVDERADGLDATARAELLHAIATHHDRGSTRTAEAAVLYDANQLDAVAATRPVGYN